VLGVLMIGKWYQVARSERSGNERGARSIERGARNGKHGVRILAPCSQLFARCSLTLQCFSRW
jgi:hypothetical protein